MAGLQTYIAGKYAALLQENQLSEFEQLWHAKAAWFEEPNERRGGWSGVGRLTLQAGSGAPVGAYLKRQDQHCHRSWRHPLHGVPTFQREFDMLQFLQSQGLDCPEVMFYGRQASDSFKTVLLTRELQHYVSLETLTAQWFAGGRRPPLAQQQPLIIAVAQFARRLHALRVHHRSFYPKHLFIHLTPASSLGVAVIDLEKSRRQSVLSLPVMRTLYDLAALNRHAEHWSHTRRLSFLLHYLDIPRLTPYAKWLCRRILQRSSRPRKNQ